MLFKISLNPSLYPTDRFSLLQKQRMEESIVVTYSVERVKTGKKATQFCNHLKKTQNVDISLR